MESQKIIDLLEGLGQSKHILVDIFPGFPNHRIGYEPENKNVTLLIKTLNPGNLLFMPDIGKYLEIHYEVDCLVKKVGGGGAQNQTYTMLELKSKDLDLQKYFIDLSIILINRIGNSPTIQSTKDEILKIESIFRKLSKISKLDSIGLWGELFIIESSKDPEYLLHSWHINSTAKLDFNDGHSKIEVKTTTQKRRVHHFEMNQLWNYMGSPTIVASILTEEIDNGRSISDLIQSIKNKVPTLAYQALIEKVFEVVGDNIDAFGEIKYDYSMSKSEIKFFDGNIIPRPGLIPKEVTYIKFKSDLTGIPGLTKSKMKGKLFKLL
jgi:hypothetical protein